MGLAWALGMASSGLPADGVGPSGGVSLSEAQGLALSRNWDLLAARADVDFATAQSWVARQLPNPTLAASMAKVPADGRHAATTLGNGVFQRSYDTIAAFNQLVEVGGKRRARKDSAREGLAASQYRLEDARRQLVLAVTRAYVAARVAETGARIQRDSAASLRREADIAGTRLRAGDISVAEKQQIEIAADRLELDAARAEADARAARVQLQVLLGVPKPDGVVELSDTLESLAARPPEGGGAAPPAGLRPDVAAAEADVRRAEADYRLAKANRVPDPTFLVQYEREPPDQANTLGFGVSLPLPLWNRNQGAIAAADAARRQARIHADQAAAQVAAELAMAIQGHEAAWKRREHFVHEVLPKSTAVRESITLAYERGGASLLDLLTAQRNDNEVRLAEAQATADAAIARAALDAARSIVTPSTNSPARIP